MLLFQVIPRTECVDIAALTEDLVQRGTSDMEALAGRVVVAGGGVVVVGVREEEIRLRS